MADNLAVTPGSGATVAAEACSGTANALVQRIKLVLGATDTDGGNVSSANPMPVLSGTAGNFLVSAIGTVTAVSGTAANMLVSASGTVTALSGTAGNFLCTVTQGSSVTVISGTAGNLLAQVSGTVTATGTVTVLSGTAGNLLSTVSGTVTAVSGTASNLLVQASGTITATGTVTVLSGTAANLLSQVSGSVTALSGTAGNFLATVTQGSSVTVISPTATNFLAQIQGGKTNNNAAPGATNIGALVGIANASAVTYTEGDQVLLSTDLSGNVRVTGSLSVGGTTDEGTFTPGSSTGTPAMGVYNSTTASIGTGQVGVVAVDKWRHLQTTIVDAAGNSRGANVTSGNAMLVDASATVQPVLSGTAANFLVSATGTVTAVSGTAGNLLAQVSQGTAANLLTLTTLTAGTNNIGQVISGQQMSIYNGTAALTVSYAAISFTASAGNTIVGAVASKNIYILSGLVIANAATNLQWFSGTTAGTAVSGVMAMTANMGYQIPYVPVGNFSTLATNAAITLSSSVACTIGGWVTYVAF